MLTPDMIVSDILRAARRRQAQRRRIGIAIGLALTGIAAALVLS